MRGAHRFTAYAAAVHGAAVCGTALLLAAGAAPASAAPSASDERDVQLVYCLSDAHRDDLVAAAVALGLLVPGSTAGQDSVQPVRPVGSAGPSSATGAAGPSTSPGAPGPTASASAVGSGGRMTLRQWAGRRTDDFTRACSALMAAAAADSGGPAAQGSGAEDGWFETFLKGLPALAAGALLTLGGQLSERVSSERRLSRQRLRTDEAAFRGAARTYLAAYESDPEADHTAVRSTREAQAGTLFQIPGPAARRRAAALAVERLPLAGPLPASREGVVLGSEGRAREAREAGEAVDLVLRTVSDLDRGAAHWALRTVLEWRSGRTAPGAAV
ncbi:hypothetical protein ACFV5G_08910 [Streptomyces sp. NPDC059766]|uniref:hypothetical protein n=1 Tax=Streptomyces sp. NPDC059766 TaxID=3346940 RepID=UPI003646F0CF